LIAYFDTSALVKRYAAEEGTEQIAALWAEAQHRAVSRLAYAETLSALSRKEREQPSEESELSAARARFLRDWSTLLIIEVSPDLHPGIRRLLEEYPLKGADAVHLASCLLLSSRMEELPVFACWDKQLLRAARDEALETVPQQSSGAAEPENSVHSEYPTEPDTGG
jgi:predicted nucleic acid-binding protein